MFQITSGFEQGYRLFPPRSAQLRAGEIPAYELPTEAMGRAFTGINTTVVVVGALSQLSAEISAGVVLALLALQLGAKPLLFWRRRNIVVPPGRTVKVTRAPPWLAAEFVSYVTSVLMLVTVLVRLNLVPGYVLAAAVVGGVLLVATPTKGLILSLRRPEE